MVLVPLVSSSTDFKEKHHSHVPLPRERLGKPTFLLDATCVQGMAERCVRDKHVPRDSVKGKEYKVCWDINHPYNTKARRCRLTQISSLNEQKASKKTKCIGFIALI